MYDACLKKSVSSKITKTDGKREKTISKDKTKCKEIKIINNITSYMNHLYRQENIMNVKEDMNFKIFYRGRK